MDYSPPTPVPVTEPSTLSKLKSTLKADRSIADAATHPAAAEVLAPTPIPTATPTPVAATHATPAQPTIIQSTSSVPTAAAPHAPVTYAAPTIPTAPALGTPTVKKPSKETLTVAQPAPAVLAPSEHNLSTKTTHSRISYIPRKFGRAFRSTRRYIARKVGLQSAKNRSISDTKRAERAHRAAERKADKVAAMPHKHRAKEEKARLKREKLRLKEQKHRVEEARAERELEEHRRVWETLTPEQRAVRRAELNGKVVTAAGGKKRAGSGVAIPDIDAPIGM